MELIEKKIKFEDSDLLAVMSMNQDFMSFIENRFKTAIILRGTTLILRGQQDEISALEKIFKELNFVLQRGGTLGMNDVIKVVELLDVNSKLDFETLEQRAAHPQGNVIFHGAKDVIRARTPKQLEYYQKTLENDLVFAIGPAGTGKTFLSVAIALAALRRNEVARIILSRPAVEAGESLGFLPGDLREKIDPYLRPLKDALHYMLSGEKLKSLMEKETIEINPLAYMRGRTLSNAFIILDEAQNATITQMKMFLTRLGTGSKAIITGDVTQIDLPNKRDSGLINARRILEGVPGIGFIYFDNKDVVRHKLVADIIRAYERETEEHRKSDKK
ncbi:MAG: PhoH family protein [Chloroflexota bacterium]